MNSPDDIVEWYKGTGLRPFLDMLPGSDMEQEFLSDYRNNLSVSYAVEKNGNILLPFTRVFFTVYA
jgi:trans-aconitate 2-methyltransferase